MKPLRKFLYNLRSCNNVRAAALVSPSVASQNQYHHILDVTYHADHSQVRKNAVHSLS